MYIYIYERERDIIRNALYSNIRIFKNGGKGEEAPYIVVLLLSLLVVLLLLLLVLLLYYYIIIISSSSSSIRTAARARRPLGSGRGVNQT